MENGCLNNILSWIRLDEQRSTHQSNPYCSRYNLKVPVECNESDMRTNRKKRLTQKVVKPTFWGQPLFLFFTIWLFIPFLKREFLLISEFY
ncbi:hypothetical protein, partial [Geobacillus thermodenitrificans]|uniref:hypothetical protein n=1 Tax=Geobacillus thermodenitrificans TaxID=33940 RepID=UPI0019D42C01